MSARQYENRYSNPKGTAVHATAKANGLEVPSTLEAMNKMLRQAVSFQMSLRNMAISAIAASTTTRGLFPMPIITSCKT